MKTQLPYITRKILMNKHGEEFLSRWIVIPVLDGENVVEIRAIGQTLANQRLTPP